MFAHECKLSEHLLFQGIEVTCIISKTGKAILKKTQPTTWWLMVSNAAERSQQGYSCLAVALVLTLTNCRVDIYRSLVYCIVGVTNANSFVDRSKSCGQKWHWESQHWTIWFGVCMIRLFSFLFFFLSFLLFCSFILLL